MVLPKDEGAKIMGRLGIEFEGCTVGYGEDGGEIDHASFLEHVCCQDSAVVWLVSKTDSIQ